MVMVMTAGVDKSWKVRLCFAKLFPQFAEVFGEELTNGKLIQVFTNLLSDNE